MEKITIRRAEKTDCPQMLDLIRELAIFEKQPDEVTVTMTEFVESGFGGNPVWGAFVAETECFERKIIGISLYYIRYSTWKGRRLYLEDLIVTEHFRGRGIGKKLFEKTWDYCLEKGYRGMSWQALDWNEPALDFYRKYQTKFDSEWINISMENTKSEF